MSDTIHVKIPKDLLLWLRSKAKAEERSPGWLLRKFALERMTADGSCVSSSRAGTK